MVVIFVLRLIDAHNVNYQLVKEYYDAFDDKRELNSYALRRVKDGADEYLAELAKFNLEPDMCEFDDLLVQSNTEETHLQLFAMTEYNVLLLYVRKG